MTKTPTVYCNSLGIRPSPRFPLFPHPPNPSTIPWNDKTKISKRAATVASKPSRPPTPSKVAQSTKRAFLGQREVVSEQDRSGRKGSGARQMRNQYWRYEKHHKGMGHQVYSVGLREVTQPWHIVFFVPLHGFKEVPGVTGSRH